MNIYLSDIHKSIKENSDAFIKRSENILKNASKKTEGLMKEVYKSAKVTTEKTSELMDEANKTAKVTLKGEWGKASKGYTKIEKTDFEENSWITPKISKLYQEEYSKYENEIENYTLQSIYKLWAKKLNEYILFSLFGNFIIFNKNLEYNSKHSYQNEDEERIQFMARLNWGVKGLKGWLENSSYYLPLYLNEYDEKWLKNYILPLIPGENQVLGSSFDRLGNSLSYICNNLLKYVDELERKTARVEMIILREKMTLGDHLKDLGLSVINPWSLICRSDDILNRLVPNYVKDKNTEMVIHGYTNCKERWEKIIKRFLPPLIISTQKSTYIAFSEIIKRDLKYLKKCNRSTKDIKLELLDRYLKLEVLDQKEIKIGEKIENRSKNHITTYGKVVEKVYEMIEDLDFSFMIPLKWEQ